MSAVIEGVPASVTMQQVADLLAALGLDPTIVPRGAALRLGPKALQIEVYAVDAEGRKYAAPNGKTIAMHNVSIPIEDES